MVMQASHRLLGMIDPFLSTSYINRDMKVRNRQQWSTDQLIKPLSSALP